MRFPRTEWADERNDRTRFEYGGEPVAERLRGGQIG
jgi:hypothetical protein